MTYEEILGISPFSLTEREKEKLLTERLTELTLHHRMKCTEYEKILDAFDFDAGKIQTYRNLPFLPVRLFKEMDLKSVPSEEVVKTMTSSGTTGQAVSRIYLDRTTSANQQKTMVKIVSDFTGSSRMPMIIIDCPGVVKDRKMFSARGAGILGFSIFGAKKIYALNDDMKLDVEGVKRVVRNAFLIGGTVIILLGVLSSLVNFSEGVLVAVNSAMIIAVVFAMIVACVVLTEKYVPGSLEEEDKEEKAKNEKRENRIAISLVLGIFALMTFIFIYVILNTKK